jgi:hypothetical protein
VRQVGNAVREPGPALVEKVDAAESTKLIEPARQTRLVPRIFDMGHEAGHHDEVRSLAEDLIIDVDIAAFRVASDALRFGTSLHARLWAILR